jgi:hypothetical protein
VRGLIGIGDVQVCKQRANKKRGAQSAEAVAPEVIRAFITYKGTVVGDAATELRDAVHASLCVKVMSAKVKRQFTNLGSRVSQVRRLAADKSVLPVEVPVASWIRNVSKPHKAASVLVSKQCRWWAGPAADP